IIPLLLAVVMVFVPLGALAAGAPDGGGPGQGFAPDRILVKFKPGVTGADIARIHQANHGAVAATIAQLGVQVVRVDAQRLQERLAAYRSHPQVAFAEPDYVATAVMTPNDPYFKNQWGLVNARAPEAWNTSQGSASVTIAVCDSGIDLDHPDLQSKLVAVRNFTDSPTADDKAAHGTHVAGIAAAATNNGLGVAGMGFSTRLLSAKVLDDTGSGWYSWVASGIAWAADQGARVINLSLGGANDSSTLQAAVDYAWGKGCLVVAAAGNDNSSQPFYPACYANCIAVAAIGQDGAKASFSNYGAWVDIAAPGVDIASTVPNHQNAWNVLNYAYASGTSMASPFVAGAAALVAASNPGATADDIRQRLLEGADPASGFSPALNKLDAADALYAGTVSTPTVSTQAASGVTATGATLNGTVTSNGGSPVTAYGFRYRPQGGTWVDVRVGSSDVSGSFNTALANLSPGTVYQFYAWATNAAGTATGSTLTFTTASGQVTAPVVTTSPASGVIAKSANLNGTVVGNGGAALTGYGFQYRKKGASSWTRVVVGSTDYAGPFTARLNGLAKATTYEFYAWAANSQGLSQGTVLSFTTKS
ncbi:MAG: S8 family serine peptidase, partial [Syntrophomonadaceae bacterium]|nr:S8 family serine peptidase [Syntrophomonadaceae bacterium]